MLGEDPSSEEMADSVSVQKKPDDGEYVNFFSTFSLDIFGGQVKNDVQNVINTDLEKIIWSSHLIFLVILCWEMIIATLELCFSAIGLYFISKCNYQVIVQWIWHACTHNCHKWSHYSQNGIGLCIEKIWSLQQRVLPWSKVVIIQVIMYPAEQDLFFMYWKSGWLSWAQ